MLQKETDQPKEVRGYALHFLALTPIVNIPPQALRTFLAMLKFSPHNMTVIDELLPLLSRLHDWNKGIEILQNAFDYFRTKYPHGPPSTPLDRDVDPTLQAPAHHPHHQGGPEAPCRDVHIVALADYCLLLQFYDRAICAIRNGARWLQGRRTEVHWEGLPDDREFDLDPGVRKGPDPGMRSGMHPLDVNMRHRLARTRIKMGDHDEGRVSGIFIFILVLSLPVAVVDSGRTVLDACRYCPSRGPCALWRAICGVGRCIYGTGALFRCTWDLLHTPGWGPGESNSSQCVGSFCDGHLQVTIEVVMQAGLCHQRLGKLNEARGLFEWSED